MIKQFALAAFTVLLAACSNSGTPTPPPPPSPPTPPSPPAPPPSGSLSLGTQLVASGFDNPLFVTYAPGATDLYVVEKTGKVQIIEGSGSRSTAFMNVAAKISTNDPERGLLSIAFDPKYTSNSYVYAFYTGSNGDGQVSRFTANRTAKTVDSGTEKNLLTIPHSTNGNHNGGQLQFGPDGYLYISAGDGGSQGDPNGNGQNTNVLNGKILRIDVNGTSAGKAYAIPTGNPYTSGGGLPEIWAYGLRNPWRFSFDRSTGDMWIADVGGGLAEEVNFQSKSATGGKNYGWHVLEGNDCVNSGCDKSNKVFPVYTYPHTNSNCSITGGYVYRGTQYAAMQGRYFMGDYCTSNIWSVSPNGSGGWTTKLELSNALGAQYSLSSFGEGPDGSLYVTNVAGGKIYKLIAK